MKWPSWPWDGFHSFYGDRAGKSLYRKPNQVKTVSKTGNLNNTILKDCVIPKADFTVKSALCKGFNGA